MKALYHTDVIPTQLSVRKPVVRVHFSVQRSGRRFRSSSITGFHRTTPVCTPWAWNTAKPMKPVINQILQLEASRALASKKPSNPSEAPPFHTINGYVFSNGPPFEMCEGDDVACKYCARSTPFSFSIKLIDWFTGHFYAYGSASHIFHMHGNNNFSYQGRWWVAKSAKDGEMFTLKMNCVRQEGDAPSPELKRVSRELDSLERENKSISTKKCLILEGQQMYLCAMYQLRHGPLSPQTTTWSLASLQYI